MQIIPSRILTYLPITVEVADEQIRLLYHHRDPFDWLLVALALIGGLVLVSNDPVFDQYGVQ